MNPVTQEKRYLVLVTNENLVLIINENLVSVTYENLVLVGTFYQVHTVLL